MLKLLTISRVALAVLGVGLALGYHLYYVGGNETRKRIFVGLLIAAAAISFYTYAELGPHFDRTRLERLMNPHDFYHYYIGAKYHRELGYFHLYECTVVADAETRRQIDPKVTVRDLRTHALRPAGDLAANPQRCKSRFSAERWSAFLDDVEQFTGWMHPNLLYQILKDKGYNATPVWTRFAAGLTRIAPLDVTFAVGALLALDLLWALVIFIAAGRTFGRLAGLYAVLFWGVNYTASTYFVKGSLSRLDWLVCLVLALCLLRRRRYTAAGIFAGLATVFRVFPLLFFAGLFCKALVTAIRTRSVPRHYLRFFVAFAVSAGLLVGLTSLTSADRRDWGDFADKIRSHDEQLATYRVGLKYAVIDADPKTTGLEMMRMARTARWVGGAAAVLTLVLLFTAAPRMRDDETLGLSFVLVFVLIAPTFYYYQMLLIPFLLFLPEERRTRFATGMAVFFGWSAVAHVAALLFRMGPDLTQWLSRSLLVLCVAIAALALSIDRRRDEGDAASELPASFR